MTYYDRESISKNAEKEKIMTIRKIEVANYSSDAEMQEFAELFLFLGLAEEKDFRKLLEEFKVRNYISSSLDTKIDLLLNKLQNNNIRAAFSENTHIFRNLPIFESFHEGDTKNDLVKTSKTISTLLAEKIRQPKINCPHHFKESKVETLRLEKMLEEYVENDAAKSMMLNSMKKLMDIAVKDVVEQNQE